MSNLKSYQNNRQIIYHLDCFIPRNDSDEPRPFQYGHPPPVATASRH